ncbi:DUF2059 domain-containing protein [Hymenobacter cellulosilyticus]|uniref:DUF2059 domain-containing protein n=1 Tax=Hymenobacter cellulosilyticus TaxID=2932248 RepID=A0A8T9Q2G2_9BACT|nr:DUF2059 domain-containing protein [Hymenobacter cellulosilyticus]UOQ71916.1 DUF2059 domain-containing protein [Hymenobacter cellulosilyticus]
MRILFPLAVAALLLTAPAVQAQTTTPSPTATSTPAQRKAAEALLSTMQVEKTLVTAIDRVMTMQIQQRPEIAPMEPEMRAFMTKYMSWSSLKDEMISLYAAEFSEKELQEMTKFYATPPGRSLCRSKAS